MSIFGQFMEGALGQVNNILNEERRLEAARDAERVKQANQLKMFMAEQEIRSKYDQEKFNRENAADIAKEERNLDTYKIKSSIDLAADKEKSAYQNSLALNKELTVAQKKNDLSRDLYASFGLDPEQIKAMSPTEIRTKQAEKLAEGTKGGNAAARALGTMATIRENEAKYENAPILGSDGVNPTAAISKLVGNSPRDVANSYVPGVGEVGNKGELGRQIAVSAPAIAATLGDMTRKESSVTGGVEKYSNLPADSLAAASLTIAGSLAAINSPSVKPEAKLEAKTRIDKTFKQLGVDPEEFSKHPGVSNMLPRAEVADQPEVQQVAPAQPAQVQAPVAPAVQPQPIQGAAPIANVETGKVKLTRWNADKKVYEESVGDASKADYYRSKGMTVIPLQ